MTTVANVTCFLWLFNVKLANLSSVTLKLVHFFACWTLYVCNQTFLFSLCLFFTVLTVVCWLKMWFVWEHMKVNPRPTKNGFFSSLQRRQEFDWSALWVNTIVVCLVFSLSNS